jgi:hypothetical protein
MKNVLVIGGCGTIGKHLCKHFIDKGYFVVCVDDMSGDNAEYPESWSFEINVHEHRYFVYMYMDCAELFEYDVKYFGEDPQWDIIIYAATSVKQQQQHQQQYNSEEKSLQLSRRIKDVIATCRFFEWLPKLKTKPKQVIYFTSKLDETESKDWRADWHEYIGQLVANMTRETCDIPVDIYECPVIPAVKDEGKMDVIINYVAEKTSI